MARSWIGWCWGNIIGLEGVIVISYRSGGGVIIIGLGGVTITGPGGLIYLVLGGGTYSDRSDERILPRMVSGGFITAHFSFLNTKNHSK